MKKILLPGFAFLVTVAAVAAGGSGDESEAGRMQKVHQQLSVDCFNKCWSFIDKTDRTAEDAENMVLLAASSLWHWKQREDCKPSNLSIGYWQFSRA